MIELLSPALAGALITQVPAVTTPVAAQAPVTVAAAAQAAPAAAPRPLRPAPRPINFDEDYSSFRGRQDQDLWTRLKYIPITDGTYFSLGGEFRPRYEIRIGERFGRGPQDENGNFQQRTRLWGDLHIGSIFRAFVDIEHATADDLESSTLPIERGRADLNQAFVEARIPLAGNGRITARVGRQEVGLGNFTLFDMREGANIRRSLDLARVMVNTGRWEGGVFGGYNVIERAGSFDDASNLGYQLLGGHLAYNIVDGARNDRIELLFVNGLRRTAAFDSSPSGRDNRNTLSLRYAGRTGPWNYDFETVGQWGTHGNLDIRAYFLTGTLGYGWQTGWKPRVSLRAEMGSGDGNPNDGTLGTWGQLFPRPLAYNGDLGQQNLTVLQPQLSLQPTPKLNVDLSTAALFRTSTRDGVYALSGQVIRRGNESDESYVGQRFATHARYSLNPWVTLGLYMNYTIAGPALLTDANARDLFYATPYVAFRF